MGLKYSFTPLQPKKKPTLGNCLPSANDLEVINKIRVLVEGINFQFIVICFFLSRSF
jgi:hypothetical protein